MLENGLPMKFKLFVFLLCFSLLGYSQIKKPKYYLQYAKDTLYSDVEYFNISKKQHNIKLKSNLFSSLRYENDTLVLHRLRHSYLFGKLDSIKRNQLFLLFSNRNKIDTTKIMVIHYQDTLKKISEFPEKSGVVYTKDSTSHRHAISHSDYVKNQRACTKNLRKKNTSEVYHFFKHNNGHPLTYKKERWYKDYFGIINELFRDYKSRFHTIVIHPNGDFFCMNYTDGNKLLSDIAKGKRWEKHKNDFFEKLDYLNSIK